MGKLLQFVVLVICWCVLDHSKQSRCSIINTWLAVVLYYYTLRNILCMPAAHVCVKTCVFNCNKRAYREARVYRMVLNRLMWSWTISHGDCLDGLITDTITYLELDCCTGTVLGRLGMVITSYSSGTSDCLLE